jgi:hypothetical protein
MGSRARWGAGRGRRGTGRGRRDGEQRDGGLGEDDGRLGGVSAELGLGVVREAITAANLLSKNVIIFRKVRSKKRRGAARSGAKSTSPERSDERATIGLRYIVFNKQIFSMSNAFIIIIITMSNSF